MTMNITRQLKVVVVVVATEVPIPARGEEMDPITQMRI